MSNNSDFVLQNGLQIGGFLTSVNGATPSNGQLLIGDATNARYSIGSLTGANGVIITPGAGTIQISSNATNNNTANTIVSRDSNGNFVAGTITADVVGNAASASKLFTARTINGVSFDGTTNISFTTDAVAEGSTNLYFTDARASAAAPVQTVFGRSGNVVLQSSDVSTALGFTPINPSLIDVPNGLAVLDSDGYVPMANMPPAVVGGLMFQGTWDASANSPTIVSGAGTTGYMYKVATAGNTVIDGIDEWNVGDIIAFDGVEWIKFDGITSEVLSVAGRTGNVVLSISDISGGAPLASPAFTGTPIAPTASLGDNSSQIATTKFVMSEFSAPPSIGSTSPNSGYFTTLNSTGLATLKSISTSSAVISGGAINNTPVGASTPSTGAFTSLTASGTVTFNDLKSSSASITGGSIDGVAIGSATPSTGSFTTLQTSSLATLNSLTTELATISGGTVDGTSIGSSTPESGTFTTLASTGAATLASITSSLATISGGSIDGTTIGSTNPSTGIFTSLSASDATINTLTATELNSGSVTISGGSIDGTSIGSNTPDSGAFTTISSTGLANLASVRTSNAVVSGGSVDGTPIGATTPSTGHFTTMVVDAVTVLNGSTTVTGGTIDGTAIGATTPSTGNFTSITTNGNIAVGGHLYRSVSTVSAAGTTQATASQATTDVIYVTSATSGSATGVMLPVCVAGSSCFVINNSGSTITLYPPLSGYIDFGAQNAGVSMPNQTKLQFVCVNTSNWFSLNATYA